MSEYRQGYDDGANGCCSLALFIVFAIIILIVVVIL